MRVAIGKLPIVKLAIATVIVAGTVACAKVVPPRVVVPPGTGTPEPKALDYWWAASNSCRTAQTFSAELKITGRVAGNKLGRATIHSAVTRQDQIRLEAVAPIGGPIFVLAGTARSATLTLPRDKRVLTAPAADIVEALIGIRLTPWDWLDVLSGCVRREAPASGVRIGDAVVLEAGSPNRPAEQGAIVLRPEGAAWRIAGGERVGANVDYQLFAGTWPAKLRINSRAGAPVELDLTIDVSQTFVNTEFKPAVFQSPASGGFTPMTLAELRAIGPLGDKGGH